MSEKGTRAVREAAGALRKAMREMTATADQMLQTATQLDRMWAYVDDSACQDFKRNLETLARKMLDDVDAYDYELGTIVTNAEEEQAESGRKSREKPAPKSSGSKMSSDDGWLRFATQKSFDWGTTGGMYGFEYYTGRKKDDGKIAVRHEGVYHVFGSMDEAEKFIMEKKKERDAAEKSKRRFSEAEEDARKTMSSLKGDKVDSFTKRRMAMMSDESTESIGGSYKEITEGQAVENIKMAKSNEPPLKYGSDAIHVSIEDNEYQAKVWRYPDYVYETSVKSSKEQAIADAKKWINANPADTWGRNPKNPKVK